MTKAHKNAEVTRAWADGKVIQWRGRHDQAWVDFDEFKHQRPWDGNNNECRIKPGPKKGWARVAEHKDHTGAPWTGTWADFEGNSEADIEACPDFVRWLSPRFDFDYPEDYEGA